MANKHMPMSRAERAKQFMAFDALTGLRQVLAEKERITVPKMDLSEEYRDELDRIMQGLKVQDMIRVVYFDKDEYVEMKGMIAKIEVTSQLLTVVNTKIPFQDIYRIEKI